MKLELITAAILSLAAAQTWSEPTTPRPDPADPEAAVAPLVYRSAFDGYRKHADEKVDSWKAVNDNVGRVGGWRAYLKEAQQPDEPDSTAAAPLKPPPSVKPAVGEHRDHRPK
jgi:hypothetical protein